MRRPPRRGALRFRRDRTFTLVQFTDVHWSTGDGADARSKALLDAVLEVEAPDLVVFTGDLLEGSQVKDPEKAYREVLSPVVSRGLPWAAVFGNHDDEGPSPRGELLRAQRRVPRCLAEAGPEGLTGVGNYLLRVLGSRGDSLALALYFLDSNAYAPTGLGTYAWIAHDQIAWYNRTSKRLTAEYKGEAGSLPALMFFHIPLPEYALAWNTVPCRGSRFEPVCGPDLNSGLFTQMVERGDVMGTFVGHDHVNDFEGELHGIRLCYGRASGYSPYGRSGFPRGARVVRLREGDRSFTTWLRLDDGSSILNPKVHEPEGS